MKSLPESLLEAIELKAEELKHFKIDYQCLGNVSAIRRLKEWCSNFLPFINDLSLLKSVVNNIRYISDDEIVSRTMEEIKTEFVEADDRIYFCPLGGVSESSSRITRLLNYHPGFFQNLKNA